MNSYKVVFKVKTKVWDNLTVEQREAIVEGVLGEAVDEHNGGVIIEETKKHTLFLVKKGENIPQG